jgi:hypothetical protein
VGLVELPLSGVGGAGGALRPSGGSPRVTPLYKLDPISERIRHMHPLHPGQRHVPLNGVAGVHTADDERRESFDSQRRMGLASTLLLI